MRFLFALVVFSIFGVQAHALSCARPNTAQTFNTHQESPHRYTVMVGTVQMTGKIPTQIRGKPRKAKGRVAGRYIGRNGLSKTQIVNVTVETSCAASWCGGFPTDMKQDVLIYLKQTPRGNVIEIGACPGGFGQVATDAHVKLVQKCLRKGGCSKADIKRFEQQ